MFSPLKFAGTLLAPDEVSFQSKEGARRGCHITVNNLSFSCEFFLTVRRQLYDNRFEGDKLLSAAFNGFAVDSGLFLSREGERKRR